MMPLTRIESRTSQLKAKARIDIKNLVSNLESRFQFTNTQINTLYYRTRYGSMALSYFCLINMGNFF